MASHTERVGWVMMGFSTAQTLMCTLQIVVAINNESSEAVVWLAIVGVWRFAIHFFIALHLTIQRLPNILQDPRQRHYQLYVWLFIILTILAVPTVILGVVFIPSASTFGDEFYKFYIVCVCMSILDFLYGPVGDTIGWAWVKRPPPTQLPSIEPFDSLHIDEYLEIQAANRSKAITTPPIVVEAPVYTEPKAECSVCLDARKNMIVFPCAHFAICDKCVDSLKLCPICRTPITSIRRVYEM